MNAVLADRAAALEVERAQPTPRLPKPDLNVPDTPQQQAALAPHSLPHSAATPEPEPRTRRRTAT